MPEDPSPNSLRRAVAAVAGAAAAAAAGVRVSRYPGGRAFKDTPLDQSLFYGRDADSEALLLRVLSVPLLVLFGRSGAGKTSLLRAGLFPRLRRQAYLPALVRLKATRESPADAVAFALREAIEREQLQATVPDAPTVWEVLAGTTAWRDDLLLMPVLVFDQFEEAFTVRDAAFRTALATELGALASGTPPASVRALPAEQFKRLRARPAHKLVLSVRSDYLAALQELTPTIPGLYRERLWVEALTQDGARRAIVGPAGNEPAAGGTAFDVAPFDVADDAVEQMLQFARGGADAVDPFVLQLACKRLEAVAAAKHGRGADAGVDKGASKGAYKGADAGADAGADQGTDPDARRGPSRAAAGAVAVVAGARLRVEAADLAERGGLGALLGDFYVGLADTLPGRERRRVRRLCEDGLIDPAGRRLMLEREQIARDYEVSEDTLRALTAKRLLRAERRLESVFYQIGHERLAGAVSRQRPLGMSRRARRAALNALATMVLIAGVAVVYVASVVRERHRTESLAQFLLGPEVLGDLRDAGHSATLERVDGEVRQIDRASQVATAEPLTAALILRNRGDVALTRGQVGAADEAYRVGLRRLDDGSTDPDVVRTRAGLLRGLADVRAQQGDVDGALGTMQAALAAWSGLAAASCSRPADTIERADVQLRVAELRQARWDVDGALADQRAAVELLLATLIDCPARGTADATGDAATAASAAQRNGASSARGAGGAAGVGGGRRGVVTAELDGVALGVLSRAVLVRGNALGEPGDYAAAARLANAARTRLPFSSVVALQSAVATAMHGDADDRSTADGRNDVEGGDSDQQRALRRLDGLVRWDPSNQQWRRERAATQLLLAETQASACSGGRTCVDPLRVVEQAFANCLDALATLTALEQPADGSNASATGDVAWALRTYALVLATQGDLNNARQNLWAADAAHRRARADAADLARLAEHDRTRLALADVMARLGDLDGARTQLALVRQRLAALAPMHGSTVLHEALQRELEATTAMVAAAGATAGAVGATPVAVAATAGAAAATPGAAGVTPGAAGAAPGAAVAAPGAAGETAAAPVPAIARNPYQWGEQRHQADEALGGGRYDDAERHFRALRDRLVLVVAQQPADAAAYRALHQAYEGLAASRVLTNDAAARRADTLAAERAEQLASVMVASPRASAPAAASAGSTRVSDRPIARVLESVLDGTLPDEPPVDAARLELATIAATRAVADAAKLYSLASAATAPAPAGGGTRVGAVSRAAAAAAALKQAPYLAQLGEAYAGVGRVRGFRDDPDWREAYVVSTMMLAEAVNAAPRNRGYVLALARARRYYAAQLQRAGGADAGNAAAMANAAAEAYDQADKVLDGRPAREDDGSVVAERVRLRKYGAR